MRILLIVAGLVTIVAIFLTTPAGRTLAGRLGLPWPTAGGAPRRDRQFLLGLCGGDRRRVEELLEAERRKFSELTEADIYRRVIRSQMKSQMKSQEEADGDPNGSRRRER